MKIATWNINSVRRREELLCSWLDEQRPDLLLLQEIKCEEAKFPAASLLAAGYRAHAVGEKSYNGVAVLSRSDAPEPEVRLRALPGEESGAARYLEVGLGAWIVASLYLPNGNPAEGGKGEKFLYKLRWMEALTAHAASLLALERPAVLAGDYNIIPTANDCLNPAEWEGDALFRPESRLAFRRLLNAGWIDPLDERSAPPRKEAEPGRPPWTYWSYRGGAFAEDDGIRIDHLLLSPQAADCLIEAGIDREARAGKDASDHTPVWCRFQEGEPTAGGLFLPKAPA